MRQSANAFIRKIEEWWETVKIPAGRIHDQLPPASLPPASGTARGGVKLSTSTPLANGTASPGDSGDAAQGNHVHPSGGGGSLDVTDGATTVSGAVSLTFPSGTVTDNGGGAAEYTPAGGGGGMRILSVQADASSDDGGTPVNATQVPDLTLTIAGSAVARRAMVSFALAFTAAHPNHIGLFLDTAIVFPATGLPSFPGTVDAADAVYPVGPSDSSPTTYYATLAAYVVTIPGDSADHAITVCYSAALATTATVFFARSLVVTLIADSGDVLL